MRSTQAGAFLPLVKVNIAHSLLVNSTQSSFFALITLHKIGTALTQNWKDFQILFTIISFSSIFLK
jgi:hypothetical protein